jgi:hypothetical protein
MTFPLLNSSPSLSSPSSSRPASAAAAEFVLDRDAVLRRASSIAGCAVVVVPVAPSPPAAAAAAPSPSSSPIFPGVSVRRAAFQAKSVSSSGGSSSGSNLASNSDSSHGKNNVLSFIVSTTTASTAANEAAGEGGPSSSSTAAAVELARVTIFLDTGTVCTSRVAPFDSKVRHVFRRNVTTLDAIERLLKYPPSLTPIDHTIVGLNDDENDDNDDDNESEDEDDDDVENDENQHDVVMVKDPLRVLRAELELADVGVAILDGEKAKLEHHLQSLVEQQQQPPAKPLQSQWPQPNPIPPFGAATLTPPKSTATPTTAVQVAAAAAVGTSAVKAKAVPPSSMIAQQKDPSSALVGGASPSGPVAAVATPAPANAPKQPPPPATTLGWNPQPRVPAQPPAQQLQPSSPAASIASSSNVAVITKDIGMEFQFSLSASSMKHVDQCMSDITGMNKLIRGVATSGRGTVFLYGNGGVAYTPNIPRSLHHKLSQLRSNTKMSSRPSYVSLGSKDRFYCAFHDGTYCLKGPKSLEKELKRCFAASVSAVASVPSMLQPHVPPLSQMPVSVAFGSTWESWFVVFPDGSWKFQGKIPADLSHKLASRKDRGDLVRVTLGPSGEWFVKARNGRMWWGGLTDAADASIQRLLKDHELCFLDFGEDGSYFVSYD